MKKDLESRRRAIARALRGRTDDDVSPNQAPRSEPVADEHARAQLRDLTSSMTELATRVDQLSRDLSVVRSATAEPCPVYESTAHIDDDEPLNRVSVPPVSAARISDRAFDVLLGRG